VSCGNGLPEFVLRMRHALLDRAARASQRFEALRRRLEAATCAAGHRGLA